MTPYSAHVVMRMNLRYGEVSETTSRSETSDLGHRRSVTGHRRPRPDVLSSGSSGAPTIFPTGNSDLRHLPQVQHLVDLILGQNLLPLHEIANENVLLH